MSELEIVFMSIVTLVSGIGLHLLLMAGVMIGTMVLFQVAVTAVTKTVNYVDEKLSD